MEKTIEMGFKSAFINHEEHFHSAKRISVAGHRQKKKTKWYSVWHIVNSGVGGGQRCEGGQVFSRGHHERGVQRQQANTLAFEASLIKYE